jgi:putative ABC transport system permease protein
MRLSHYARIAVRESRRSRGRILLFAACIAVGVAAIVLVAGLSAGINEGIRTEGRRLLAGDVSVEGQRPLPAELNDILRQFAGSGSPIERTDLREFVSIVAGGNGATQLSEIKVVEGEYPFYGKLILDPDRPLGEILNESTVVVGRELLSRLDINVGDEVRLGGASFRVAGTVIEEPDKLSVSFTLGPRVFLSAGRE